MIQLKKEKRTLLDDVGINWVFTVREMEAFKEM